MKFLILRFSSIGDIVLTTPVVRCLRDKFPDAEIHYATKKQFNCIVEHNPYINKIHLLEDSIWPLMSALKKEAFNYIFDLHHNQRTLLIKTLLGVPSSSFNKINFEKWLLVNFKINRLPQQHIVDRYLETCQKFSVENDGEGLDYFISKEDEVNIQQLPPAFHNGYIGWAMGAKQNTKKLPAKKIIELLQSSSFPNLPVIFLGGKEDSETVALIQSEIRNPKSEILNACGKYSLNQSASLVKQSRVMIANDTGLMHIAAAYKKPLLSVWGNTIPEFGMSPYYGKHEIRNLQSEIDYLKCRPCSKLGYNTCPKRHFNCMNLHNAELMAQNLSQLLAP